MEVVVTPAPNQCSKKKAETPNEEMRPAMALAEHTANASARHVNVVAREDKLHEELQFLRNQLSEVLALQSASQRPARQTLPQPPQNWPPPQPHHHQYLQWTNDAMHRTTQHYLQRRQPVRVCHF